MTDASHSLAGPKRVEVFLVELANLRPEAAAINRFMERFKDFDLLNERMLYLQNRPPISLVVVEDFDHFARQLTVPYLHAFFRAIWTEPDIRTREWALAIFRTDLARTGASERGDYMSLMNNNYRWLGERASRLSLATPPEELPVETAFDYLLDHHNRARHCPAVECPAPYFFANRHSQKYCSEKCAQSGERETKRRWWAEHGPNWRKKKKKTVSQTTRRRPTKSIKRGER